MLDLEPRAEGRALLAYHYDGDDQEVVARGWIDATMAEVLLVVHEAAKIGLPAKSEWTLDFIAAHRWLRRRRGRRCATVGCPAVLYNDGGVWHDSLTDAPHTCEV